MSDNRFTPRPSESESSFLLVLPTQIHSNFAELYEGGFKVVHDFLGENVRVWEIVRLRRNISCMRQ